MQTTFNTSSFTITAERYTLTFPGDRPFVIVKDSSGTTIAELFSFSSVHTLQGRDDTVAAEGWQIVEDGDQTIVTCRVRSSLWQEKEVRFRCGPLRFSYEVAVSGQGRLAELHLFGGYYSGSLRWGSGFFLSGQSFTQGFNPEPNRREDNHFSPAGSSLIDMMGVPLPGRDGWFFTPPPFCFVMAAGSQWLGIGVEAAPGANLFTEYRYQGQRDSFNLTLNYEGHTAVDGRYELPAIGFDFCDGEYEALAAHVAALQAAGYAPARAPVTRPLWWRTPIFSGWGAQCYVAGLVKGHAPAYCLQQQYEKFMQQLADRQVEPGIVVIDDKWQASYGLNDVDSAKWPDLRGFITTQHQAGRHVLLWLKLWDPEGLPAAECITNAAGMPVAADPTNPTFLARLRAQVRLMLGPDGYDADGFKIDFSARTPSGPGMHHFGPSWGLELMEQYLRAIYTAAKEAKPDALVMTHTPHPYLAGVTDMIRLNDINTAEPLLPAMLHRARIAAIACPGALIDTDNWPIKNRETWRSYVTLQAQLGIPSLYYTSHVDSTGEPLEAEDYQLLRDTWAGYRVRLQAEHEAEQANGRP